MSTRLILAFACLLILAPPVEARLPMPRPLPKVVHGPCPFDQYAAACTMEGTHTIWLTAAATRGDYIHELGHNFDYAMSEHARQRFLALTNDPRAWRSPPNSPHEQFAEAYRMCWQDPRFPDRNDYGYDYAPSAQTHRKVCRTIRREADRQGWKP